MWIALSDLFWLAIILLACLAWWHTLQLREQATLRVQQYCREQGLQLLDGHVALKRMQPARCAQSGRLMLVRQYQFHFTATGDDRYEGCIELQGRRVLRIQLAPHRLN